MNRKGFTLIEFLIVMTILAVLATLGISTYVASFQRSRDSRRKADLNTIQKALESYYNDYGIYPANTAGGSLCADTAHCYLKTTPTDPSGYIYYYVRGNVSGTNQSFQLYSALERLDDTGTGVNQSGYAGTLSQCMTGQSCKYGVSSTNTTP